MHDQLVSDKSAQDLASLVAEIQALPENRVQILSAHARAAGGGPTTSADSAELLLGLRLALVHSPSMAHSGWLYARLSDSCRDHSVELSSIGIFRDGLFRALGQFSWLSQSTTATLILGVGADTRAPLEALIATERAFDPSRFDADGELLTDQL